DEVVVLPWVPATATLRRVDAMAARTSARSSTGMPSRRASTTSTLSAPTAGDAVITSAPATCSARCPISTAIPWEASRSVTEEPRRSLPLTRWPIAASTVAMALIPAPPIPTTCTRAGPETKLEAVGSAGMGLHQGGHRVGRVGPPEGGGRPAHRQQAPGVGQQLVQDVGQPA